MKIVDIKKHLLSSLDSFAKTNGFKVVESKFILSKTEGDFVKQISFEYNSWEDEIHIFPYAQIKSKTIHNICERYNFHLNYTAFINLFVLKEIADGNYFEDTRWQLQADMKDRFVICDESDLDKIVPEIQNLMDFGLDYLHMNSDIKAIDKMYNSDPLDSANPNCSGMDTHCIIGLIASKLSKNENHDYITDIYTQIVGTHDFLSATKECFAAIKTYLFKYSN